VEPIYLEAAGDERALQRNLVTAVLRGDDVHALPANRELALLITRALRAPGEGAAVRFAAVAPSNTVFAFLPGLLVLALLNLALFGTGAQLLADRASGALKLFRLSPASATVLYGAQLASRLLLALLQIAVFVAIARYVYAIPLGAAAVWGTLGFAAFGALVLLSLGYALGSVLGSQARGTHVFTLVNLFLQFFGDVLFPSTHFPLMHAVAIYLPTSYLVDGLRQVMLGLPSANGLVLDAAVLALWGAAAVLVVRFRFTYEARA
jgi:ABC-2 type transport system permease protein